MKKRYDGVDIIMALSRCLLYLAVFIMVPSIISIVAQAIIKDDVIFKRVSVPIMMASYVLVVLILSFVYRIIRKNVFSLAGLVKTKPSILVSSSLLGVGMYGLAQAIIILLTFILPKSWVDLQGEQSSALLSGGMLVAVIYTVIVAPFCEEFIFRGLITSAFVDKAPKWVAIIIPAILFSVIHLPSPIAIFYTFILGLVLGFVRFRTKSLLPCILLHCLFNATNYMLYLPFSIGLYIVWAVSIPFIIFAIIDIVRKTRG